MDEWQSGFIERGGIRLHYTRTGGENPPLVLVHGSMDDGRCWGQLATALAPEYDVIVVDARGHGRSDAPPDGYDLRTLAADLAGVIRALDLPRPFIAGHSLGAGTALVLAGLYPDLAQAIVLEDPGPWWAGWPKTPEDYALLAEMRDRHVAYARQTREALIVERNSRRPNWTPSERVAWAEAKLRVRPAAFAVFEKDLFTGSDWPALLAAIPCPVLLVTTDPKTGGVTRPEQARALQAMLPQLQIAHIPGAGHSIRRDQFIPFLAVARAFLTAHDAPVR
jgi:N-formylmaleamate deformylase